MTYFEWKKRPPRKFRGKPQWTLDEVYISPFTARRRYDEEGVMHYDEVERRLHPTGVEVMDHYLRRLTEGQDEVKSFCKIYGLRTEDMDALIFILTGMSGPDFRMAYQLRLADDLLRYTDLPLAEVARRSGLGSHTNFCVVIRRERKQTPTERRSLRNQKRVVRDASLCPILPIRLTKFNWLQRPSRGFFDKRSVKAESG